MKIKLDDSYSAQRLAKERGIDRVSKEKLRPIADSKGVVDHSEIDRLARVANLDMDQKLSPAERQRIEAYLEDRSKPIVADAKGSSALDVRAGTRKPVDAYIAIEHRTEGKNLVFTYDVGVYKAGSTSDRDEHAKQIVLKGLTPNTRDGTDGIRVHRYASNGADASVGYESQGSGAGYLVGIADKNKGVVLANFSAAGAIKGDAPEVRSLFSPPALAKNAAVKALAKKEGLDPKRLSVEVLEVSFHSDFQKVRGAKQEPHPTLHTLLLTLELKETGSRKKPREVSMTALVHGNPAKALGKLKLDQLEAGVQKHWGFIYPPSVKFEEEKKKPGAGESVDNHSHGGGGEGGVSVGGGGESGGGSIGGGGE
ncbi:MAG: hypothetical protein HYV07_32440 [Deltaproteobacteria bacterium]|nr:hypothetical protein [Deltaproteobacteria bacterium]